MQSIVDSPTLCFLHHFTIEVEAEGIFCSLSVGVTRGGSGLIALENFSSPPYILSDDFPPLEENYTIGVNYETGTGMSTRKTTFRLDCSKRNLRATERVSFQRSVLTKYMLESRFSGASGYVSFNEESSRERNPDSVTVGAHVVSPTFPNKNNSDATTGTLFNAHLISIFSKDLRGWEDVVQESVGFDWFSDVFSGTGRLNVDNNYLRRPLRRVGFFFMAVVWLLAITTILLLVVLRDKEIVRNSQPVFLTLICVGALVMSTTILTLSYDESSGRSTRQLSVLCSVSPWLFFLGQGIISASLMGMLRDLDCPTSICSGLVKNIPRILTTSLAASILVLTIWTSLDPWSWERRDLQDIPPATYGSCQSDHYIVFAFILFAILFVLAGISLYLALHSVHHPDAGSILYASYAHLQCWCFGLPMLGVLGSSAVDGTFFGRVLIIWILSITSVVVVAGRTILALLKDSTIRNTDTRRSRMVMASATFPELSSHTLRGENSTRAI